MDQGTEYGKTCDAVNHLPGAWMQAWASAADVEGGVLTAASLEAGTGYPSTASLQTTAAVLERYSIMLKKTEGEITRRKQAGRAS
jgi:hypothetical protein